MEADVAGPPEVVVAGRYRLVSRLGAGGAGVVWRAEDTLLRRAVAIKELHPMEGEGRSDGVDLREDMLREARAAARLNHPGAVTVFDVVHHEDRDFIVMQLVDGPNLAEVVSSTGPLDVSSTADLGLQLLDVLEAAHGQGIVHRDVKPANVMFPSGSRAQLADFGIARLVDDPRVTATGLVRGTPQYMAPEQALGHQLGPATDLWALGATLYYAVEGQPPFDRGQALATLASITADPPRAPLRAGPLEEVLQALLAKEPAARTGDIDVRRRLRAVADSGTPTHELLTAGAWPARGDQLDQPSPPAPAAPPPPAPSAPPSAPPTAPPTPDPPLPDPPLPVPPASRRSARPWLVGAAGLVAAAAVALVVVMAVGGSPRRGPAASHQVPPTTAKARSQPPATAAPTQGGAQTPATSAPSATAGSAAVVPASWASYTDSQTGFRLRYPPGWRVTQHGTLTTFSDPATGDYVLVDHQTPPAPTPQGPWYQLEPGFAAGHAGYQRIGITPTTFHGLPAAVWEYRYNSGSTRLHAIDLGMIAGSHGYALNAQASDARWGTFQPELAQLEAGFTPVG